MELAGVRVPASSRIGAAGTGWATWHETMLDGIVLLAAYAMGGARYAFEITLQYAKDRQQFDKPLGAFQAIAHYLADASTTVEGGTILVHEAAWARANGRPIDRLAPMAKLFACQTFRDVTAMAQQVFGGVGFTIEYDIQLYFRRAKQLQISWWDDRYLEELVADGHPRHRLTRSTSAVEVEEVAIDPSGVGALHHGADLASLERHAEHVPVAEAVELPARRDDRGGAQHRESSTGPLAVRPEPAREVEVLGQEQRLVEPADGLEVRTRAPEHPAAEARERTW